MSFRIVRDNIIKVKADVIVNTAGPKEMVAVGEVVASRTLKRHPRFVFRVSGPVWMGGRQGERELLRKCYDKALAMAVKHRCESIAFPLISSGNNGFPKDEALKVALAAINSFLLENEIEIILVVFDKESTRLSDKLFDDVHKYIDDNYVAAHSTPRDRMFFASMSAKQVVQKETIEVADLHMESVPSEAMKVTADSVPFPSAKTFTEYLIQLLNKKGIDNSDAYKAALMTRQYFSKLISGKIAPSKDKLLDLAVGIRLNLDETKDLLGCAGDAISRFSRSDLLYEYYIKNGIYDLSTIHCNLYDEGLYKKEA
ncbi:MAG: macro domain-containing protein [Lachnospiraceae bacterium]|nr:macro domain-containing protein [Lachnospiraceae bacterium]